MLNSVGTPFASVNGSVTEGRPADRRLRVRREIPNCSPIIVGRRMNED